MGLRNDISNYNVMNGPSLNAQETIELFTKQRGRKPMTPQDELEPDMVVVAIIPDDIRNSSFFAGEPPDRRTGIAVYSGGATVDFDTNPHRPGKVMAVTSGEGAIDYFSVSRSGQFLHVAHKPFDHDTSGKLSKRPYGTDTGNVFVFKSLEEWQRFINWPEVVAQRP